MLNVRKTNEKSNPSRGSLKIEIKSRIEAISIKSRIEAISQGKNSIKKDKGKDEFKLWLWCIGV